MWLSQSFAMLKHFLKDPESSMKDTDPKYPKDQDTKYSMKDPDLPLR